MSIQLPTELSLSGSLITMTNYNDNFGRLAYDYKLND